MSRDFAKKKAVRKKPAATPKKPEKQSRKGLIYLAIALIVGLFVAFLVYLEQAPSTAKSKRTEFVHPGNQKVKKSKPKQNKTASQKSKQSAKEKTVARKNEPQFDFYTMLPDMQVEVNEPVLPKQNTQPSKPQEPKHAPTNIEKKPLANRTNKQPYQLQVGAFQSLDKADSMKARLAFLGIESNISIVWMDSNKKIYRVRIGPSKDVKKLDKIRGQLRAQNINTILQKAL